MTSLNDNQFVRDTKDGVELNVSVIPRSARCVIAGISKNSLRIKLTSPPIDNEANIQCCDFIAKKLEIARRQVSIIRGNTSRKKVLRIAGVTVQEVREKMLKQNSVVRRQKSE